MSNSCSYKTTNLSGILAFSPSVHNVGLSMHLAQKTSLHSSHAREYTWSLCVSQCLISTFLYSFLYSSIVILWWSSRAVLWAYKTSLYMCIHTKNHQHECSVFSINCCKRERVNLRQELCFHITWWHDSQFYFSGFRWDT